MKTSIYNIGATALLIFGIYYYNILSMDEQKETNDIIDIINNKLELFGNNNEPMTSLLGQYSNYIKNIPKLASYYENDNEFIVSLNKIKSICNNNNVRLDELSPKIFNTLDIPQNPISDLSIEIERHSVNLSISGSFLNIGKVLSDLSSKGYLINSMEINSINKNEVDASLSLLVYRSKPHLNKENYSIDINKIIDSMPSVPNEKLADNMKWKNDIFSESRLLNKKDSRNDQPSSKKEYLLSRITLAKPKTAIINNKLYNIGSKIGAYTISRIDEKSVILSGNRRSIILELEIDEDQTVYSLEGFKKAFSNARKNNKPTFIYKGKLYSTQIEN